MTEKPTIDDGSLELTDEELSKHIGNIECSAKVLSWVDKMLTKNKVNPRPWDELVASNTRAVKAQVSGGRLTPYYVAATLIKERHLQSA